VIPPFAIEGYEAMSLLLGALRKATKSGTKVADRSKIVAAMFGTRTRASALGTYGIDADGDTSLRAFGIYGIVHGKLRLIRTQGSAS